MAQHILLRRRLAVHQRAEKLMPALFEQVRRGERIVAHIGVDAPQQSAQFHGIAFNHAGLRADRHNRQHRIFLQQLLNQQVILLLRQPNCHRVRMVDAQAAQRFLRRGDHPRLLKAEFFPLDCAERFDNRRVIRRQ